MIGIRVNLKTSLNAIVTLMTKLIFTNIALESAISQSIAVSAIAMLCYPNYIIIVPMYENILQFIKPSHSVSCQCVKSLQT